MTSSDPIVSTARSISPYAIDVPLTWEARSFVAGLVRAGYEEWDTGQQHGPQSRADGRDCGCGWGSFCDARPGTLCDARPWHGERTAGLRWGQS